MRILTATFLVLCVSGTAMAGPKTTPENAILRNVTGKVLVSTGQGYETAMRGTVLQPGDSVMVGANGMAKLYFPKAKCQAQLPPGQITTISGPSMCQQSLVPAAIVPNETQMVITPARSSPPVAGEIPPLLIAGGILIAGTAAAIDAFSHNNSSSPPVSAP